MTARHPCPHCGRSTAIIGRGGQLARHACVDSPGTMTPAERVRTVRDTERRLRGRREHAATQLVYAEAWTHRFRAMTFVALGSWLIALFWAAAPGGSGHLAGLAVTLAAVWIGRANWRRTQRLAVARRAQLAELDAQHSAAHAQLVALEAALPPDVVWPELHACPIDLDNLED